MQTSSYPRANVLGLGIAAVSMPLALDMIDSCIAEGKSAHIHLCTVHTVIESQKDPVLRQEINRTGITLPDGMPLVWLNRLLGHKHVGRVYGPDLMLALMKRSVGKGFRHYFYGGGGGVATKLAEVMRDRYPGVHIVGTRCPPFRNGNIEEEDNVIGQINAAKPDIVWVGLGTPKQDWWIIQHRDKLQAPVLVGVGAAFDFHTGRINQAPRWMMRMGLEWLFRLLQEPRRLWKRYLIYNPWFVWLVLLQLLGLNKYSLSSEPQGSGQGRHYDPIETL